MEVFSMKNKKLFPVIIVVAFLAVAGIGYAIANSNKSDESMSMSKDNHTVMTKNDTPSTPAATPEKAADAANSVTIENYKFGPATMTVKVGTKVTWTNQDTVKHTVTVDSGDGPKSELFGKGQTFSYTFTKAGSYSYHCEPHPYMKATVTVTE
jgi:amicyanin